MTRAKTVTKMPLDRWAEIIGISPVHFSGAIVPGVWEYSDHLCNDIWYQYPWQSPEIATREHIATLIRSATDDIERFLGYYVAPTYLEETQIFPHNPVFTMHKRRLINFGQYQKTLLVDNDTASLDDLDGDGFLEVGTYEFVYTGVLDALRFYTGGKYTDESYRLYPKSVTRVGNTVTVTFDSWVLIDPALWEKPPALVGTIDISDLDNYNLNIDVTAVTLDPALPQAEIIWTKNNFCSCNGSGCAACTVVTQPACVDILDAQNGYVRITPVKWDTATEQYLAASYTHCEKPSRIKFYYTSGLNPTPFPIEEAIAWLAGARLRFAPCSCSGVKQTLDDLVQNMVEVNKARQIYISILSPDMVTNIFGTRMGEFKAYQRLLMWDINGVSGGIA